MSEKDVTLVNAKTNETPQVLASGQVDAIGAWQPVSGSAMKALPGSRPIYTSAQAPGLIYDVLYASPASLSAASRRLGEAGQSVGSRRFLYQRSQNPGRRRQDHVGASRPDASRLQAVANGTHLIGLAEGKKTYGKADGLTSLYGSSKIADDFNVKNAGLQGGSRHRWSHRSVRDERRPEIARSGPA